jgi:hypothetical protein
MRSFAAFARLWPEANCAEPKSGQSPPLILTQRTSANVASELSHRHRNARRHATANADRKVWCAREPQNRVPTPTIASLIVVGDEADCDGWQVGCSLDGSGERAPLERRGHLCGDEAMRALLHEAAQVMLTRGQKWSWLKAWAMNIAKRRGQKKAIVALARRLAVIMHRMWSDGTEFRWTREMAPTI